MSQTAYQYGRPYLRQIQQHLRNNLLFLELFCHLYVSEYIRPLRPEAGYLVWLNCSGLLQFLVTTNSQNPNYQEILNDFMIQEAKVMLSSGPGFGFAFNQASQYSDLITLPVLNEEKTDQGTPTYNQWLRLNIACTTETLFEGLMRITRAIQARTTVVQPIDIDKPVNVN